MALSDLTNTTWTINESLTSYAGGSSVMKQYSINILTSESIRNTYGDSSIDSFIGISIGYNNGPEYNQVSLTASSGVSEYSDIYILASGYDTKTLPDT